MTLSPWDHDVGLDCREGIPVPMSRAHRHQDIEINVVIRGSITYLFGGRFVEVEMPGAALFWASVPHQLVRVSPDARLRWLNLPLAMVLPWKLGPVLLDQLLRPWPTVLRRAVPAPGFADWATELASPDAELSAIALLEIQAYTRRLLHEAEPDTRAESRARRDDAVVRATAMARFIAEHFAERITVADVADVVHLHPRYAMTIFRRVVGLTVGQHLEQCRVAEAQRLLITSDATAAEIAHAAGFGSVSRLYAAFTPACGQSPAAYRLANRPLIR
ncbi:AraC family transcriptional regulator [Krasilnikovia cinnamomea]|uniref:AraC family transcriptional regulator n=2 Tax=Krasilnikovia cinnamomea TaxID=349313 RepID=A0A4V2G7Q1_9ACTN|nr:AraC family transcriptional regulator [Krasilnikovia cinnamomea]